MSKKPAPPPSPSPAAAPAAGGRAWVLPVVIGAAVLGLGALWVLTKPPTYTPVPAPAVAENHAPRAPAGPMVEPQDKVFAGYAGDAACKSCHAQAFEQWAGSHHGLAERAYRPDLDEAAFKPDRSFAHGTQSTSVSLKQGKAEVTSLGFEGKTEAYPVERVIGHDPLRQFLVAGTGGRLHTLEATWDPHKSEWFNVFGTDERKPGDWGHWTGRGMVWNTMCASCHNTRVRKNYDESTDVFKTAMAAMTVSCESCHGPMKQHALDYQSGTLSEATKAAKAQPGGANREAMFNACAMCHARRSELTGDFKPGDNFFDHHSLSIVDESDLFYPDGQIRDEDYEFTSFLSSRMHAAGVRCVDCHNPHTAKPILPGNELCMRCHSSPAGFPNVKVVDPATHTFHQAGSTGSQCVNCHMPQTTYMQRHPRHDHGFTIPDPLLTKQFNIPNACNKCHQDKDVDWALAATEKWYGDKMNRPTRTRATLMAKARRGDDDARDALVALLATPETPSWKASASLLLQRWTGSESVRAALQQQLSHEHPMVRESAVRALEPALEVPGGNVRALITPMLEDPSRNVRVAAAWALRDQLNLSTRAAEELQYSLQHNADQPSGQMQLGQWQHSRNNSTGALAHFQKAVQWDPNSPPLRRDLAMMHSITGDAQGAIRELREAIRQNPRDGQYHYELGLALNEARQPDEAIAALREAVKVDPRMGRAWYNLGLALNQKGEINNALQALAEGTKASPGDGSIPYARATILARLGRRDEALQDLFLALQAQPGMPEALELRAQLEGRSR